jgi:hypothetical protein
MKAASSSKTLVPTYNTTLHYIPEDSKFHEVSHTVSNGTGTGGIKYCDNDGCSVLKITEVLYQLER